MSEYQYYEFTAVDRPLTTREQAELRSLSTRADITATSFVNTYEWGDFKGDPRQLMERYFDASSRKPGRDQGPDGRRVPGLLAREVVRPNLAPATYVSYEG